MPTREWTHAVSELAYEVLHSKAIELHRHFRLIRLDKIRTETLPHRFFIGSLFRIAIAVSDLIWRQIEPFGMSLLLVDELEGTARLIGMEMGPSRTLCSHRYEIAPQIFVYSLSNRILGVEPGPCAPLHPEIQKLYAFRSYTHPPTALFHLIMIIWANSCST